MLHHKFVTTATLLTAMSGILQAQTVNDSHGKEWRQLTDTTGRTWNQAAQLCPTDGATPCTGNLAGWVWGTQAQVLQLFSYHAPLILTDPASVTGFYGFFAAESFFGSFRPTFSFAITYASSAFAAGWTSSTDLNGQPIIGTVGTSTTPVSIDGSLGLGPVANPDEARNDRGVFLWRSTGPGGVPVANDDSGSVPSPDGGTAVANVLANDWFNGVRATTANVRLSQQSSSAAGITLDLLDGSVDVARGTPAGVHTLIYQICDLANAANCAQARVTVVVPPYGVNAVNDAGTVSPSTGGVAVANVLANDILGSSIATLATVRITQQSTSNPAVTLNPSTGAVNVAAGAALGIHTLTYQICEIANPTNCDPATVTVTVQPYVIDAVNDYAKASSKTPGVILASVLTNDTFAGVRAATNKVKLSPLSLSPPTNKIALNLQTGAVTLTNKVDSVTYSLVYQICEIASPANCDQATATLELSGGR